MEKNKDRISFSDCFARLHSSTLWKMMSMKRNLSIVGYTTGVFDLFHVGHLNILKHARSMCDRLIVGVTTDELALQLKGRSPVISFSERVEIVNSIRYVDEVSEERTDDKIYAWHQLKFNRIFKGSDWQGTEKWNQLEVLFREKGVDVVYFPYTEKTSSTLLRSVLSQIQRAQ